MSKLDRIKEYAQAWPPDDTVGLPRAIPPLRWAISEVERLQAHNEQLQSWLMQAIKTEYDHCPECDSWWPYHYEGCELGEFLKIKGAEV